MRVLTVLAGTLIISEIVYRPLVVVDEIENFPVGSRKMRQTFLNDGASILFLHERFRIIRRIFDHVQRTIIHRNGA